MMKINLSTILAVVLLVSATQAKAQIIISVNLGNTSSTPLAPTDSTGAFDAANWNNEFFPSGGYGGYPGNNPITTPLVLNDSTGAASAVTMTAYTSGVNGATNGNTGGGTPQLDLFDGGLNNNFGSASFTVAGLSAFSSYDITAYYIAYAFGGARDGEFVASGAPSLTYYAEGISTYTTTYTLSNSTTSGVYAQGNYVTFSGLTGDTQTITYQNPNNNVDLAGFQITGVLAVPEPSTWALMFGGFVCLIAWQRARHHRSEVR